MPLIDNLLAKDKAGIFKFDNYFTNYSTGFLSLDYVNAMKVKYLDDNKQEKTLVLPGVMSGKFITIIGLSGGGKSTIAQQIGWNIIKPFADGALIFTDCEHAGYKTRIYDITDCDRNDHRYVHNDEMTYIETVMDQIIAIAKEKEALGEAAMYDVQAGPLEKVFKCKSYKMYVPTVVIIDSLPEFVSEDMKLEMESTTSALREAQVISQFYKKCLGICAKYNIIVIAINHIKPKQSINQFDYKPPQLMLLKKDETLPRGEAPVYLASTVLRLNPSGSQKNSFTMEEHGFDGFLTSVQVVKSKTTFIGGEVNLVFREDIGYDPVYSIYQFAYDAGLLEGKNPYLRIHGVDDYKFSKKTFRSLFLEDTGFQVRVINALMPYLNAIAGCKDVDNGEGNIDVTKLFVINDKGEFEPTNLVDTGTEKLETA